MNSNPYRNETRPTISREDMDYGIEAAKRLYWRTSTNDRTPYDNRLEAEITPLCYYLANWRSRGGVLLDAVPEGTILSSKQEAAIRADERAKIVKLITG